MTINEGKIYGIIGPSGCGKSTLLRLLNLLIKPTTGTISFNESSVPLNRSTALSFRRKMTLVFQNPTLFKTSVRENIAYGLKARGINGEEIHKKVSLLLEKIGLQEVADQQALSLSGGEAQRVALARAVAFDPKILLLDEPTANLDPTNVEVIENLVVELNKTLGITIIIVTHNIFQARRITDCTIFLYDGKIVEMDDTEKIFTSPQDPRTKAFVEGRMIY
ncbi:phosphate ABC transporter ATP-binding protein [Candidatus Contubernalis alkalaceticus]|nr:phosphate ABC transporter ATP-binding protein [Candidatus Contubernalis alkalaceticus]